MKLKQIALACGVSCLVVLSGCTQKVVYVKPPKPTLVQKERKPEYIKITGIGYGATNNYELYSPAQRRLMAIRASKLDAYRSLAEQIYGVKIDSNTTVSAMMSKSDSFRARVNALVRGARVVSVTPMADGNYETVLEVYVDKQFFKKQMVYSGRDYEDDQGQSVCDVAVSGAVCLEEHGKKVYVAKQYAPQAHVIEINRFNEGCAWDAVGCKTAPCSTCQIGPTGGNYPDIIFENPAIWLNSCYSDAGCRVLSY